MLAQTSYEGQPFLRPAVRSPIDMSRQAMQAYHQGDEMSIENARAVVFLRGLGEAVSDSDIVREVILEFLGEQGQ